MGLLGYLRFGDSTADDILLNYDAGLSRLDTLLFSTGRIGMVVSLVLSYPLILFPARICLHTLLRSFLPSGLRNLNPNIYFLSETIVIIAITFGVSVVVPTIVTVFGLTGACVTFIMCCIIVES